MRHYFVWVLDFKTVTCINLKFLIKFIIKMWDFLSNFLQLTKASSKKTVQIHTFSASTHGINKNMNIVI